MFNAESDLWPIHTALDLVATLYMKADNGTKKDSFLMIAG